jgi:hypothetical protein
VYSIRNRVKIRKIRNEAKRCHVVCQEDCTWFINASEDGRKGAIMVKNMKQSTHVKLFGCSRH